MINHTAPKKSPATCRQRRQNRAKKADEGIKSEIKRASALVSVRITGGGAAVVAKRPDFFD